MNPRKASKEDYIEQFTGGMIDICTRGDENLTKEARDKISLDGVYSGQSPRIRRLVKLAYLRGIRRGASLVWNAHQPLSLRVDVNQS